MQKGDGPNETRRGKSLGGKLWLSETEVQSKFKIGGGGGGGFDLECVDVCHLGLSGGMLPGTFLILSPLKWLQMHLKLTWGGKTYILSTTKKLP